MEIISGVHGSFKITKPNRFSSVQFFLKLCLTMVAINFRVYPIIFPTKKNKMLLAISYLNGAAFNWVQPRLDFFLENDDKKQKQKTQQMFYKFDNFCIYIKEIFGNQDEDDAALASKFYEKLKNKIKNAMVAMYRPKSVKKVINIAVKIDDRNMTGLSTKKHGSNLSGT